MLALMLRGVCLAGESRRPPKTIDSLPRVLSQAKAWVCQRFSVVDVDLFFKDPTSMTMTRITTDDEWLRSFVLWQRTRVHRGKQLTIDRASQLGETLSDLFKASTLPGSGGGVDVVAFRAAVQEMFNLTVDPS